MKFYCVLILTLILTTCSSKEEPILPVLSYQIDNEGNKIAYTITYDGFVNQFGENFSTKNIEKKIVVANFFFTRCPSICPPMQSTLLEIAKAHKDDDELLILSHTIDPKNDTIPILHDYWKNVCDSNKSWLLIYAKESYVEEQAIQYMTSFKQNEDFTDFYHSSYLTLLDKKQRIRGFYNSLVEEDIERLENDIEYLLEE